VLVTGANGFLGQAIVNRLLAGGHSVRALLRPGRTLPVSPSVEVAEGDLCDEASIEAAVAGMEGVVHAGARVSTTGTWEEFAEANIRGTRRVIRAACRAAARRIIHISSLSVYDVARDGVTVNEDSAYESEANGRGHYSRSKLAADRLALWEARRGAPVIVLRPGLLYGPGRRPPLARQSFDLRGWKLILARPDYPLPFSHVDNVADAVVLALEADESALGQAFTIVDANVAQRELALEYRALAGESWRPLYLPVDLIATAAGAAERLLRLARRRSPVTAHQIRRATNRAWYDCSRAEKILGWWPRVDVRDGLRSAFASLRNNDAAKTGVGV
jgi:nucleoside-diphosphate-sugar epimerase